MASGHRFPTTAGGEGGLPHSLCIPLGWGGSNSSPELQILPSPGVPGWHPGPRGSPSLGKTLSGEDP